MTRRIPTRLVLAALGAMLIAAPALAQTGEASGDASAGELVPEAMVEEEPFVPLSVPADVRMQLRDVEELQTLGDREMMRGRMDRAVEHLDQSAELIETIEQDYGDRIPPGYAPLIVAKERLSALRDQLDRYEEH